MKSIMYVLKNAEDKYYQYNNGKGHVCTSNLNLARAVTKKSVANIMRNQLGKDKYKVTAVTVEILEV